MQRLEELAFISIARGCGFAALAIATFMAAFVTNTPYMFKVGGILCLLTASILILKAMKALHHPYKRTEVWIMMEPEDRPPQALAQGLVGNTLRRMYLRFALHYAYGAGIMLLTSFVMALLRSQS